MTTTPGSRPPRCSSRAITVPDRRQAVRPLRPPRLLPRRPGRLHGRLGPRRVRPELLVARRRPRHPGPRHGHPDAAVADHHRRHHPAASARQVPGPHGRRLRRHARSLGPLAGGFITDHWGWRWLFFVAVPFGLVGLVVIARFLHLPHTPPRGPVIDTWGIVDPDRRARHPPARDLLGRHDLRVGLPDVLGLYAVGAVALARVRARRARGGRAGHPAAPVPHSIVHLSNIASLRGLDGDVRRDHLHPGLRPGRARRERDQLRPDPDADELGHDRAGHRRPAC